MAQKRRVAAKCPVGAFYEFSRRLDLKVPICSYGPVVRAANEINGAKVFFWTCEIVSTDRSQTWAQLQMQMQGAWNTSGLTVSSNPRKSSVLLAEYFYLRLIVVTFDAHLYLVNIVSMFFLYELLFQLKSYIAF